MVLISGPGTPPWCSGPRRSRPGSGGCAAAGQRVGHHHIGGRACWSAASCSPSAAMILARFSRSASAPGHGPLHGLGQLDVFASTSVTTTPQFLGPVQDLADGHVDPVGLGQGLARCWPTTLRRVVWADLVDGCGHVLDRDHRPWWCPRPGSRWQRPRRSTLTLSRVMDALGLDGHGHDPQRHPPQHLDHGTIWSGWLLHPGPAQAGTAHPSTAGRSAPTAPTRAAPAPPPRARSANRHVCSPCPASRPRRPAVLALAVIHAVAAGTSAAEHGSQIVEPL